MINRINFFKIIQNHFKTLRAFGSGSKHIYWKDLLLFIVLPFGLSTLFVIKDFSFNNQLSNLIAAVSILGGFLFNLLAIIYNSMENIKQDSENNAIRTKFVTEIHSNISYNILLAIFCVIFLIISDIQIPKFEYITELKQIILFSNYFLLMSFFLTLLMVLNRVYILLDKT